jgi:anti-sigma regulatory factor (Ser/Thr protein kinase)
MILTRALSGSLEVALAAVPESVPKARRAVCAVARANGASEEDLERIALAVSEAVTNAIVHAYGGGDGGQVQVMAAATEGELSVLVSDDGCGLGAADESRGLGLGMGVIELSADSLTITTRSSGGTLLEMRFSLSAAEPAPRREAARAQPRGSVASAIAPA